MSTLVSHRAQVPGLMADYFGHDVVRGDHPVIGMTFTPGKGWVRNPGTHKRVSVSWLRKLRKEGVTAVMVDCDGRAADFTIEEVLRYANRPMFGGKVI